MITIYDIQTITGFSMWPTCLIVLNSLYFMSVVEQFNGLTVFMVSNIFLISFFNYLRQKVYAFIVDFLKRHRYLMCLKNVYL